MDEKDFVRLADAEMRRIETAVENCSADIDMEFQADGVLVLEFGDSSKMIINRHVVAQEIWVAARSGGLHFHWHNGRWRNTRNGDDLYAALSKVIGEQAGQMIALEPFDT